VRLIVRIKEARVKQEEYLDRLIERQDYQDHRYPVSNPEIIIILDAAQRLTRLREIEVPADFAHRLEVSMRMHSRIQQYGKARLRAYPGPLPKY
jgi:hypothetical protein